jgi:hypothetical protein
MHAGRPRTAGKHSSRSHHVPTPDKISGCGCSTRSNTSLPVVRDGRAVPDRQEASRPRFTLPCKKVRMHVSRAAALARAVSVIRGSGFPPGLITGVYALPNRNERPPVQCRMPELPP